ncbi:MAG: response regulator [Halomonadaceae bacterium]|nr:MAG: response regulator [Halomonadaceae bacterium]
MLFSLVLSLVATGIQVSSEYRQERASLVSIQNQAVQMLAPNLSRQLWAMDYREIEQTLQGALALPGVSHLHINTPEGQVLSVGDAPQSHIIQQQKPLTFVDDSGETRSVGELTLAASYRSAVDSIASRTLLTLGTQGLIIFAGALGLLVIVRQTLTRHLEAMADYARRLTLDALIEPLQLHRQSQKPDELSEMERALNSMRLQLLSEARDIQRSSHESRDQRDQAVRANQAKNLFVASVSHGLRTPLQSVLGFATLLQEAPLDDEQRDYLRLLSRSAENLSALINDLLDISRMETGRLSLDQLPFDIREIIADVMAMLEPQAREKGLTLERRVDPHLPERLSGDPVRVRQVLLNLVANGIQFTDQGHVLISLEMLDHQGDHARVRLSVEDTGIGIAAADISRIHEPHVQLQDSPGQRGNGIGLGLTISQQLVRLMGGQLQVSSSPGQGSTFWMELSLPLAQKRLSTLRTPAGALKGCRILVVDAYPLSRKITLELLAGTEAHLDAVGNASDALQRVVESLGSNSHYQLIIVDGFLPDMAADRLCKGLREHGGSGLQILALSTHPQRGDAEHFRQAGANGFLSKTLRETYLLPVLQQMMATAASGQPGFITRFSLYRPPAAVEQPPRLFQQMPVMVVEDNPVNRQLTGRLLEKLGCQVTLASSGEDALAQFAPGKFHLILMDLMLPAMDGLEATRCWRRLEKAQQCEPIPIIALTASVMATNEAACREAGMNDFVPKPVSIDRLRAVLASTVMTTAESSFQPPVTPPG